MCLGHTGLLHICTGSLQTLALVKHLGEQALIARSQPRKVGPGDRDGERRKAVGGRQLAQRRPRVHPVLHYGAAKLAAACTATSSLRDPVLGAAVAVHVRIYRRPRHEWN